MKTWSSCGVVLSVVSMDLFSAFGRSLSDVLLLVSFLFLFLSSGLKGLNDIKVSSSSS